jgi:hypothetical protein
VWRIVANEVSNREILSERSEDWVMEGSDHEEESSVGEEEKGSECDWLVRTKWALRRFFLSEAKIELCKGVMEKRGVKEGRWEWYERKSVRKVKGVIIYGM